MLKLMDLLVFFLYSQVVKYKITVITGDVRNAGTDADVSLVLYGTQGDSGEWKLKNQDNNFERGK
jgi:hypothetical protein